MKVPVFWRVFLGVIALVIIGSLIAGQQNAEQSSAVQSQYEREISTTFDDLPLPPDTKTAGPKLQEPYRIRVSPGSGFVVKAEYQRPGKFADTVDAYRSELTKRGWVETYNDGGRIYFCKAPYRLELARSGLKDERIHGFSIWLAWHKRQMDESCR